MAAKKKPLPAPTGPPTIHEAGLASGPSGVVVKGLEITRDEAIQRRAAGEDVVVCGGDVGANRRLAREIESAVGPAKREDPHRGAGPNALPHFQPVNRPPQGHTFYETDNPARKARKQA
jgi:hypothetical protein